MFGCSSKSKDVDARVVNNALVVSFMSADPPRVWRADMTGLSTATLEVREGQPGKFKLVMKSNGGKEEDISSFADKEAATGALRVVTQAMLRGDEGGGAVSSQVSTGKKGGGFVKGVIWVLGIIVILWFLLKLALGLLGNAPMVPHPMPSGVKSGQPMPADKLFK